MADAMDSTDPTPAGPARGERCSLSLSGRLLRALATFPRDHDATLFITLLAAFQVQLWRTVGRDQVITATWAGADPSPAADHPGSEGARTVVLTCDLEDDPSFRCHLARVRAQVLATPHAGGGGERDEGRPLLFALHVTASGFAVQPPVPRHPSPASDPELLLCAVEHADRIALELRRPPRVGQPEVGDRIRSPLVAGGRVSMRRFLRAFETLLRTIVATPEKRLSQLPMLPPGERQQLLIEWNDTEWRLPQWRFAASGESRNDFPGLFEARVRLTPEAPAVLDVVADDTVTYRELNGRANRLAHYLRRRGVGPETRVGMLLGRSADLVIAILGILKAGGAYVPLDPDYPRERLDFMLADSGVRVVLTHEHLITGLPHRSALGSGDLELVYLDSDRPAIAHQNAGNPRPGLRPENAAYVIYTSGSTGRPKGVVVAHRSLVAYALATIEHYAIVPGDRVVQLSSISFDNSVAEIFPFLAAGAAVVLPDESTAGLMPELYQLCRESSVTVLFPPTALWHELAAALAVDPGAFPPTLRMVGFGGERVLPERIADWQQAAGARARLINSYGPTETTVSATFHELTRELGRIGSGVGSVIGRPVENTRAYVVDRHLQAAPTAVAGELCLGGGGVARGYLGRPAATAASFVPNPWARQPGERLYRTGDLVRFQADGKLEFLGRIDHQVKVRGFRIEPEEIEAVLGDHPAVRQAAVAFREDEPEDRSPGGRTAGVRRLVAYLVADPAADPSPPADHAGVAQIPVRDLRRYLRSKLPHYMMPSSFVFLDALPRTPSGKIDRRSLPAPGRLRLDFKADHVAPRTPNERILARIWSEILRLPQVSVHDNFFELGGDSILNIQIVAKANQVGLRLTPKDLFQHPTVAELAAVAATKKVARREPLTNRQQLVTGPVPLTPIQWWFFLEAVSPEPWHFNQATLLEVREPVVAPMLDQAVAYLLHHHDALRLRFARHGEGWRQHVAGPGDEVPFICCDLSHLTAADWPAAMTWAAGEIQASLDLEVGPIFRVAYFDLLPESTPAEGAGADPRSAPGRLLVVVHHLAVDTVSWRILLADLESVYWQIEADQPVVLPPKTTSYKEWAERLEAHAGSPECRRELRYWRNLPTSLPPLPLDHPDGVNTRASVDRVVVTLDAEQTSLLLREVPAAYRTQINDVLLATLALAFARWTGHDCLLVYLEGHGREEIIERVDLSRTVGWFTATYPVFLQLPATMAEGQALKRVKERLRAIPRRGVGFSLLRYLSPDPALSRQLRSVPMPQVSFNYLGQLDAWFSDSLLFAPAAESRGPDRSRLGLRSHPFEIDGWVAGGRLVINFKYSRNLHRRATVERLAQDFLDELEAMISHCLSPQAGGYTPSDFPLAGLDHKQLDQWLGADRNVEDIYPLSPMQQGMLFHVLYAPGSAVYFEQWSWVLRGELDAAAFRGAWQRLVERHAILRTAFVWQGLPRPLQIVRRKVALPWEEEDWRELDADQQDVKAEALLDADRRRGFELSVAPLMRLKLVRLGDGSYRFVWSVHHLLLDGWSISLLFAELFACYRGICSGRPIEHEPPRPYRDYIAWLQGQDTARAESFWRRILGGFTAPTPLIMDRRWAPAHDHDEARCARPRPGPTQVQEQIRLAAESTSELQALCRRDRLTLNTLIQGAWGILVARTTGESDVVFGATVSGRPESLAGSGAMLGLLINTLPVRVKYTPHQRLLPWLQDLQELNVELRQYGYSALVDVQAWSEVPRHLPLFESILGFQNYPLQSPLRGHQGSLRIGDLRYFSQTNYPLALEVVPERELVVEARYDPERFVDGAVPHILGHLGVLLDAMATDPCRELATLPLLTEAERLQLLVEWNVGRRPESLAPEHRDQTIQGCFHERFETHAERRPGAPAVILARVHPDPSGPPAEEGARYSLTYRQLNQRANQLVRHLRYLGVSTEDLVGIYLERSLEFVVAMMGVLKAGGAYVPLDVTYPRERLDFMVEDGGIKVVLTEKRLNPPFSSPPVKLVHLDADGSLISRWSTENPPLATAAENLAYVLYTSGSTGSPKGVSCHHGGVVNMLEDFQRRRPIAPGDGCTLWASLNFDASVYEMFSCLTAGGVLHVVPEELRSDFTAFFAYLADHQIRSAYLPPVMLKDYRRWLSAGGHSHLKRLMVGVEPIPEELLAAIQKRVPGLQIINAYGPTEASIIAAVYPLPTDRSGSGRTPIGGPVANNRIFLLDRQLQLVPAGAPGRIFIAGVGLGRGYHNRPAWTAEKFIPNPFARVPGRRMYDSGDLARHLPNGLIEFIGREDHQVKVRGIRVELGEIEVVLRQHEAVHDAVVTLREAAAGDAGPEDSAEDRRVVAYVVPDAEDQASDAHQEEYVSHWQTLYEELYDQATHGEQPPGREAFDASPAFNTVGWNSSYTGRPIPAAEMREWVEHTAARILSLRPGDGPAIGQPSGPERRTRALEIGCGTGLVLLRVAPHCAFYLGTDFSPKILASLQAVVCQDPPLSQVGLQCRRADDFGGLEPDVFDLVVINSVVQYFPSLDYLLRVLRGAVAATAPGGRVFVGDVRNLSLLDVYCASVELYQAAPHVSLDQMRRRVRRRREREEELVVAPAFFLALKSELPEIREVRVLPKGGRSRNELTRFRYDVVVELRGETGRGEVPSPPAAVWRDWQQEELSLPAIREYLRLHQPPVLGIRRVPDLRLADEIRRFELLSERNGCETVGELRRIQKFNPIAGAEPDDFHALADDVPYRVACFLQIGRDERRADGCFGVVFRRQSETAAGEGPDLSAPFAAAGGPRSWSAYSNDPVRRRAVEQLVPRLREYLRRRLPEPMVPAAFVLLEAMPRTPTGKPDRRALPAPEDGRSEPDASYRAPRTTTEAAVAEIWTEVVGPERIGLDDNFFDLGGHSLLATQVISRVRRAFRIELPLRALFEGPTVAELTVRIEEARRSAEVARLAPPPIAPVPRDQELPLSFAQQRLWFLHQLTPHGTAYNMPDPLHLEGPLDGAALERALQEIVRRHEVLRTSYPSREGKPRQVIADRVRMRLPLVDLDRLSRRRRRVEARRLAHLEAGWPFDLAAGALLRVVLVQLERPQGGAGVFFLLRTFHHIASDGWSEGVFYRELAALYEAFAGRRRPSLPKPGIQYADYAVWQRAWLSGRPLEVHLGYWQEQLAGLPRLQLPADRPRPQVQAYRGAYQRLVLPAPLTAALQRLSRRAEASLFMTLLAAFMALLHRYTGQVDFAVGSPIANRNREEIEGLIGFFVNNLVLRGDLSGDPDFLQLLRRIRETALGAFAHQDLPFERLVEELRPQRELNRNPLFQVAFALHNAPRSAVRLGNVAVRRVQLEFEPVAMDVELHTWEDQGRLRGYFVYNPDLFDSTRIARWSRHWQQILNAVVEAPQRRLCDLPLLSLPERHQVLMEWNDTGAGFPRGRCFHQLFEARVERAPEAVALVSEGLAVTYRELNLRANRLGRCLRRRGVGADHLVGLCVERSPEMVVALLAILKAGGAFLPLDPTYPRQRLAFMLADSGAETLLTQKRLLERLPSELARRELLDPGSELAARIDDQSLAGDNLPPAGTTADHLAYVIYTSGSTGRPKGVMIEHRGLASLVTDRTLRTEPGDAVLQFASLSFDASVFEIVHALASGAALYLHSGDVPLAGPPLYDFLRTRGITQVVLPPSALVGMPSAARELPALRTVLVAGEACPPELAAAWVAGARRPDGGRKRQFLNAYGPTEATICTSVAEYRGREPRPPIGRPILNFEVFVLDADLRPVPIGVPGQLHIGGVGLARGYLARPALTAERFIPSPFAARPGERLYKSGDLAICLADGNVDFLGRIDHQVKLRGFRIELGEIEAVLQQHPVVSEAAVAVREGSAGDQKLVAYVVRGAGSSDDAALAEDWKSEHVAYWQRLYEDLYQPTGSHAARLGSGTRRGGPRPDPSFNPIGWNSSYTGRPIPLAEMREWVEHAVERILGWDPDRVLEIGCGTGLLLLRIAPHCSHYLGTDFSPAVVDALGALVAAPHRQLSQVALRVREADDFSGIEAGSFDTVVLNSVVQYFPSIDYLLRVLRGAVEAAAPGGKLFVGDVRSLPLLDAFCAAVELHRADPSLPLSELRQQARRRRLREQELIVDPALFVALKHELPRITEVRILPKGGRSHNEMTQFRYDVILELDGETGARDEESGRGRAIRDTGETGRAASWLDWQQDALNPATVRRYLGQQRPPVLGVRGVPDPRLWAASRLVALIANPGGIETVGELRQALAAADRPGMELEEVREAARDASYTVELSRPHRGRDGTYDVIFRRVEERAAASLGPVASAPLPCERIPEVPAPRPWPVYGNDPLFQRSARRLIPQLRDHLEQRLPSYMSPAAIVLLEALPRSPAGKIDRRALPDPDRARPDLEESFVPARTATEKAVVASWIEVLGLDEIGVHDNFFELGGHSLLATQIISRLRQTLGSDLPLRSLFEHPTVAELAHYVDRVAESAQEGPPAPGDEFEEHRF